MASRQDTLKDLRDCHLPFSTSTRTPMALSVRGPVHIISTLHDHRNFLTGSLHHPQSLQSILISDPFKTQVT